MKKGVGLTVLIAIILSWSVALYFISPSSIVEALGAHTVLAVFVAGFLGGTSILFPFPYYLVVITAAAGGFNVLLIGLAAGLGVALGDSTSYLIGYAGRSVLPARVQRVFTSVQKWISDDHSYKFYAFLFTYGAIIPLPNDVVVVPLGVAKVPFWRVIIPFGLGNITFNTVLAALTVAGFHIFI